MVRADGRTGGRSRDYKSLAKFRGGMDNQIFLFSYVKKPLQKPCANNLAQRRIQKDRDQSKYIKLKTLQSRRLLQGLIKQREIELS